MKTSIFKPSPKKVAAKAAKRDFKAAVKTKKQENKVILKTERVAAKAAVKKAKMDAKLNMTPAQLKQKRQERAAKIGGMAAAAAGIVANEVRQRRLSRGMDRYEKQNPKDLGSDSYEYPSKRELRKLGRNK